MKDILEDLLRDAVDLQTDAIAAFNTAQIDGLPEAVWDQLDDVVKYLSDVEASIRLALEAVPA